MPKSVIRMTNSDATQWWRHHWKCFPLDAAVTSKFKSIIWNFVSNNGFCFLENFQSYHSRHVLSLFIGYYFQWDISLTLFECVTQIKDVYGPKWIQLPKSVTPCFIFRYFMTVHFDVQLIDCFHFDLSHYFKNTTTIYDEVSTFMQTMLSIVTFLSIMV